jgi:hypothetical protein
MMDQGGTAGTAQRADTIRDMNEPTDLDLCRVLEALSLVVGADQFMPAVPGMSPDGSLSIHLAEQMASWL